MVGTLVPGAPADIAMWDVGDLVTAGSAESVQRWSTDPRSRTPPLPDVTPGVDLPTCRRVLRAGGEIHRRSGS